MIVTVLAISYHHPQTRLINTAAKYHWNKYGDNLSFWGEHTRHIGRTTEQTQLEDPEDETL